jgi:hypothetical protein
MEYVLGQSWRNVLRAAAQIVDNIRKKAFRVPVLILCSKTRSWNIPLPLFIIGISIFNYYAQLNPVCATLWL